MTSFLRTLDLRYSLFSLIALTATLWLPISSGAQSIRVISDRTPSHLEPMFKAFTQQSGIAVEPLYMKKGLIARITARPDEADLVITATADLLEVAKQAKLLQPYQSAALDDRLPAKFADSDRYYITTSYRARAIFRAKDRVKPDAIAHYQDLADPRWKSRICIRSGYHAYNVSLWGQLASDIGLDGLKQFLTGLKANLARAPKGNDRAQIRGIKEGVCDLSIGNSYYWGIMLSRDDQRDWALASGVIFPGQSSKGTYVLRGGAGLTTATRSVEHATRLLEFILSPYAQEAIARATYAYPVVENIPLPEVTRQLGSGQPGIENGDIKTNIVPLATIASMRDDVIRILDEIDFDNP